MTKAADVIAVAVLAVALAAPAMAGDIGTPAPVAGVGIGAVALLGIGYQLLRKRIDRK